MPSTEGDPHGSFLPGTRIFSRYADSSEIEYKVYMKERAYPGKSVSHQLSLLPHVCMPVFNANVFFGGEESVMEYLDGKLFAWEPPAGWEERRLPTLMERLLQVGDEAADFTLNDAANKPLALSDYKGKIIWLMFWRIG